MNRDISYVLISDIHLGHDKNPTKHIVARLDAFLSSFKDTISNADMFIISGDVFDRLLTINKEDSHIAYSWLTRLMLFCRENNLKLRILEGTPSHDWRQVKLLDNIIKSLNIHDLDYKYFPELDIEYIEEYDMHILYIPDEWKPTAEEVYQDVLRKLREYNVEQVDMIVMHGAFKYQLPNIDLPVLHNEDDYLKICKGTINVGHVHNRSTYERILVPGSFDRLTHTDEGEIKGGLYVDLRRDHSFRYRILVNNLALHFETITINDNTNLQDIYKKLKFLSKKYPRAIVRFLLTTKEVKINQTLSEYKNLFPNLTVSITTKDKANVESKPLELTNVTNISNINLDKKFIKNHLLKQIETVDDKYYMYLKDEIDKILEGVDK